MEATQWLGTRRRLRTVVVAAETMNQLWTRWSLGAVIVAAVFADAVWYRGGQAGARSSGMRGGNAQ